MYNSANNNASFIDFSPLTTSTQNEMAEMPEIYSPEPGRTSDDAKIPNRKSTSSSESWSQYMNQNRLNSHEVQQITTSQFRLQSATNRWQTRSWKEMETEFHEEINNYSVKWLKSQTRNEKIAFLAGMIVGVDCPESLNVQNVTLHLMDPTGKIKAIIPRELFNKHISDLIENSVIVLRNISVLALSPERPCIIISELNLECIFTARIDKSAINTKTSTKLTLLSPVTNVTKLENVIKKSPNSLASPQNSNRLCRWSQINVNEDPPLKNTSTPWNTQAKILKIENYEENRKIQEISCSSNGKCKLSPDNSLAFQDLDFNFDLDMDIDYLDDDIMFGASTIPQKKQSLEIIARETQTKSHSTFVNRNFCRASTSGLGPNSNLPLTSLSKKIYDNSLAKPIISVDETRKKFKFIKNKRGTRKDDINVNILADTVCNSSESIKIAKQTGESKLSEEKMENKENEIERIREVKCVDFRQGDDELLKDIFDGLDASVFSDEDDNNEKSKTCVENKQDFLEISIQTKDPKSETILKEMFEGLDASFWLDVSLSSQEEW